VRLHDLALAFEETVASSAEVHVEGRNFYPPMLRDISAATSSIHINQFGFRPGVIGDEFAEVLLGKASDGVPVRLVVDRQGSDPDRASREFYERLLAAGIDVRVVRAASCAVPSSPFRQERPPSGTSTGSGTSTIARSLSLMAVWVGSAERGSKTTSKTVATTTSSFVSLGLLSRSFNSCSSRRFDG
jgi:hypothetical protein